MAERRRPTAAEARAEAEAAGAARRAERQRSDNERRASGEPAPPIEGRAWIGASWAMTALFTASAIWATIDYVEKSLTVAETVAAIVALGLFTVGAVLFTAALWWGAQRSRTAEMGIGGWFLLLGTAPPSVRWQLLGSVGVQIVIGIATAAARPFSSLAFGTLVWVAGLAVCGCWGARYGDFPERIGEPVRRSASGSAPASGSTPRRKSSKRPR